MPDDPNWAMKRRAGVKSQLTARDDALAGASTADATLVARVAEGDQAAFAQLYDRYAAACYGLARRIIRDDGLAQDVVQEVFASLWRKPEAFSAIQGSFRGWLLSVAHHRSVDAVRREQHHRSRRAPVEVLDLIADDGQGVVDAVWSASRRTLVRGALAELSTPQQQTLVLAYYGGYTQAEIAALLDVPLGTVKSRTATALARLRDLVPADEEAEEAEAR